MKPGMAQIQAQPQTQVQTHARTHSSKDLGKKSGNRDSAAMRELWGVIDGLLGPDGRRLGDYDASRMSMTTNGSLGVNGNVPANGNEVEKEGYVVSEVSEESESETEEEEEEEQDAGDKKRYSGEHTWWRAVRQGWLLS